MLTYPCSHCGSLVTLDFVDWIDSGTTLFCSQCNGQTIVELRPGMRFSTARDGEVTAPASLDPDYYNPNSRKPEMWGVIYHKWVRKGYDHGYAAHLADKYIQRTTRQK